LLKQVIYSSTQLIGGINNVYYNKSVIGGLVEVSGQLKLINAGWAKEAVVGRWKWRFAKEWDDNRVGGDEIRNWWEWK
jgi:hypothetical protein